MRDGCGRVSPWHPEPTQGEQEAQKFTFITECTAQKALWELLKSCCLLYIQWECQDVLKGKLPWTLKQNQGSSQVVKSLRQGSAAENCKGSNLWHLPASPCWEHVNDSSWNGHYPFRMGALSKGKENILKKLQLYSIWVKHTSERDVGSLSTREMAT